MIKFHESGKYPQFIIMTNTIKKVQHRIVSIDLLRGIAILFMVQYHAVVFLLTPEYPFPHLLHATIWTIGYMSAPVFYILFGLGTAFFYNKTFHDPTKNQTWLLKTCAKRSLYLITVSTFFNLMQLIVTGQGKIFENNIFHFLGLSLILFVPLEKAPQRGKAIVAGILYGTYALYTNGLLYLPPFLVNGIWPLVPYFDYVIMGNIIGHLLYESFQKGKIEVFRKTILWGSACLLLLCALAFFLEPSVADIIRNRKTLWFMLYAHSLFLLILGSLWWLVDYRKLQGGLISFFVEMGRIALSVYYLHLFYLHSLKFVYHWLSLYLTSAQWFVVNFTFFGGLYFLILNFWKKQGYRYGLEWFMNKYVSKRSVMANTIDERNKQ